MSLLAADVGASAGPIGLLIVLLVGAVTVALIRNMDKRLKRLPRRFDPPADGAAPERDR